MSSSHSHVRRAASFLGRVAALVLTAGALAPAASAAPQIRLPTLQREIGALVAGDTAEVEFPIRNAGSEPLKIQGVKVTCGCTTVGYPDLLQPGQQGVLKVKLSSQPLWSGTVEKHFTVFSNDPEQPTVDLQVTVKMRPLFRFSPANPIAVPYKRGDVIQTVVTVSAANSSVRITGVKPVKEGTEALLLPPMSADKPGVWRVQITLHPPQTGGDFAGIANLETTNPRIPSVPLIVYAAAQDAISVAPPTLDLGSISATPEALPPRVVALIRRVGAFGVLEVKPDTPALQARVVPSFPGQPVGPNTFQQIEVRYIGGWPKGKTTGKIIVQTTDPLVPRVEIPYRATVN